MYCDDSIQSRDLFGVLAASPLQFGFTFSIFLNHAGSIFLTAFLESYEIMRHLLVQSRMVLAAVIYARQSYCYMKLGRSEWFSNSLRCDTFIFVRIIKFLL